MSDISITPANVQLVTGSTRSGTAGATITQGEPLYLSSGTYKPANALTSATTAACVGIALNAASNGQPVTLQVSGNITIGATLTVGAPYVVSGANNGGIAPAADLTTGWYTTVLGIALSSTVLTINLATSNPQTAHA